MLRSNDITSEAQKLEKSHYVAKKVANFLRNTMDWHNAYEVMGFIVDSAGLIEIQFKNRKLTIEQLTAYKSEIEKILLAEGLSKSDCYELCFSIYCDMTDTNRSIIEQRNRDSGVRKIG